MIRPLWIAGLCLITIVTSTGPLVASDPAARADEKLIMAHYMPWYAAQPDRNFWGWHWTMNHFDPRTITDGRRQIASHLYPRIGPYDSSDPDVVEYQLLLMKTAGIDGVIIDWYGLSDHHDYAAIHGNTLQLIEAIQKLDLQFAICYEDRTIDTLAKANKLAADDRVQHAVREIDWMARNWFGLDNYVRWKGKPVLLSFGQDFLNDREWARCLADLKQPVAYFSQHRRRQGAVGGFDWPVPREGLPAQQRFLKKAASWPASIAVAFPRFSDIYEQAGVHPSWGSIPDDRGRTFRQSLQRALSSDAFMVQIVTWNDWGEGTVIEPSREYGTRDLELVQSLRRTRIDPDFVGQPADLELPGRLLDLRRRITNQVRSKPSHRRQLDAIADLIATGQADRARARMREFEAELKSMGSGDPSDGYLEQRDIPYRRGRDASAYMKQRCRLDIYYPAASTDFATVVWFHGGGLKGGQRSIPDELKDCGIAIVAADYRLHPRVSAPAYIEDAAAAVAWTFEHIEGYGGSTDRVFVSGHSAGGYLTSMVGLDKRWLLKHGIDADRIAGLIPFTGHSITHMTIRRERGIDEKQPVVDEFAPLFHVRRDAPAMLLVTGDRDRELLGRYEETAYFWRMMQEVGHPDTELVELKGFDHGSMVIPAHDHLLRFVRRHRPSP